MKTNKWLETDSKSYIKLWNQKKVEKGYKKITKSSKKWQRLSKLRKSKKILWKVTYSYKNLHNVKNTWGKVRKSYKK
jgi:hypothetical protein